MVDSSAELNKVAEEHNKVLVDKKEKPAPPSPKVSEAGLRETVEIS